MARTIIPATHGWLVHYTEPPGPGMKDGGYDAVIAWIIQHSDFLQKNGNPATERWALLADGRSVLPDDDKTRLVFAPDVLEHTYQ